MAGVTGVQSPTTQIPGHAGTVDHARDVSGPCSKLDSSNVTPGLGAVAGRVMAPVPLVRGRAPAAPAAPVGDTSGAPRLVSTSRGLQGALEAAFNEAAHDQTLRDVLLPEGALQGESGKAIQLDADCNVTMAGKDNISTAVTIKKGTVIVRLENPKGDHVYVIRERVDELEPLHGEIRQTYEGGPENPSAVYEISPRAVKEPAPPPPSASAPEPGELVPAGELLARDAALRGGVLVLGTAALGGALTAQWDALQKHEGAGEVALATLRGAGEGVADAANPIYHAPPGADLTTFDRAINWARKITGSATTGLATVTAGSALTGIGAPASPFLGTATLVAGTANLATDAIAAMTMATGLSGKDQTSGIYTAVQFIERAAHDTIKDIESLGSPNTQENADLSRERLDEETPPIL